MRVYEKDGGFTTLAMVIALLVTLSLVLTGVQAYRVSSASADIQDVADAAALAAENQVAEFMVAVRLCDAVVLSLTLTALVSTGLGVAALCTPVTASLSDSLLAAGKQMMETRNIFADSAANGLNAYQKMLPFLSAAQARKVAQANQHGSSSYVALALLLPGAGTEITVGPAADAEKAQEEADGAADSLKEAAQEAEEAAKKANSAKEEAFQHDCGLDPRYCMYQRALTLAGMFGSSNPMYRSADTWSFSVALERAKAYYQKRYETEYPETWSVADQAQSELRRRFYEYAIQTMATGYVIETSESFDCYFPRLPKNTSEMRETELYTENIYPISVDEKGSRVMHAWMGCPACDGIAYWGSIAQMEEEGYQECWACEFRSASMGQIAQASTAISNGFEYHYTIVAEAAERYRVARRELDPCANEVKEESKRLIDQIAEALKEAAEKRIYAEPPGCDGAVVLIADTSSRAADEGMESSFVEGSSVLGTRAAVSGATLLEDGSDEQQTLLTSLLDNLRSQGNVALGGLALVMDCWSILLNAYAGGQSVVTKAIESAINSIPFASESGLGVWASRQLGDALRGLGIQPAELMTLRPVLVNSGYVAGECGEPLSVGFLSIKQIAIASGEEDGIFGSLLGYVKYAVLGKMNDRIEIAEIKILGKNGPSIPLTIRLPECVQDAAGNVIDGLIEQLRDVTVGQTEVDAWR